MKGDVADRNAIQQFHVAIMIFLIIWQASGWLYETKANDHAVLTQSILKTAGNSEKL